MLPGVSFICPTFGRPPAYSHLLNEVVACFAAQDYQGPTELLILNDAPEQRLSCSWPGVRVVNYPERIPSLGDKYNRCFELSTYDIILPAEDDDLSLPNRASFSVKQLGDAEYYNPQRSWYWDLQGLHSDHHQGVNHNCSAVRKSAWQAVGGYPKVSGNQDVLMDRLLKSKVKVTSHPPPKWSEVFYVYRWGVSPVHLSGNSDHQAAWEAEGRKARVAGTFEIRPQWHRDYLGEIRRHLRSRQ